MRPLARRVVLLVACCSATALALLSACGGDDSATGGNASAGDAGPGDAGSGDAMLDAPSARDASPSDANDDAADSGRVPSVSCGALPTADCAVDIALGYYFACAAMADGTVKCWGSNVSGQMGDGTLDGGVVSPSSVFPPVVVAGVDNVRSIVATSGSVCTLDASGNVKCWGENLDGESAQPDTSEPVLVPTSVTLPHKAVRLFAGYFETCAELDDATVLCWGWNKFGQLAITDPDGAVPAAITTPTRVPALEGAIAVCGGGNAYYAVERDGGMIGFGIDVAGQLGRGVDDTTLPFSASPAPVEGLSAPAIGCGRMMRGHHQCAILADRSIACWGYDDTSQLGLGPDAALADAATPEVLTPTRVGGIGDVLDVTSGDHHTCAQTRDGSLYCWGQNNAGEAANPTATGLVDTPTLVTGLGPIVRVLASDSQFSCALEADGHVDCWGVAVLQQTGQADASTPRYLPSRVPL